MFSLLRGREKMVESRVSFLIESDWLIGTNTESLSKIQEEEYAKNAGCSSHRR